MSIGWLMILEEAFALGDWRLLPNHDWTYFWSSGRMTGRQALTIPMHASAVDQICASAFVPIFWSAQVLLAKGCEYLHVESGNPTFDRYSIRIMLAMQTLECISSCYMKTNIQISGIKTYKLPRRNMPETASFCKLWNLEMPHNRHRQN